MQDIRSRLLRIIGIVLVLLGIIIASIYFFTKTKNSDGNTVTSTPNGELPDDFVPVPLPPNPSQEIPTPQELQNQPPVSQEVPEERYVRQLARIFVERFETRSSHNDNRHIDDVRSLATTQMMTWIETQKEEQKDTYTGQTARVISSDVGSYAESEATIHVGVQVQRQTDAGSETEQKFGRVEFVQIGGTWLVDGLFWE